MATNKKQTALMSVIRDIKNYLKSIDTPENEVYKNNELLILSCFINAVEICEAKLPMEREQMINSYGQGVADTSGEIIDATKDANQYYELLYGKQT